MNIRKNISVAALLLLNMLSLPVMGATGGKGLDKSTGLYGDPIEFFKTLPTQVQYLVVFVVTLFALVFVVMFFINMFASGTQAQVGAVTGSVAMRNNGTHGILYGVGTVILVIIAISMFLFIF